MEIGVKMQLNGLSIKVVKDCYRTFILALKQYKLVSVVSFLLSLCAGNQDSDKKQDG